VAAADEESKGLFSPEGPLRTVIDEVHTALGASGFDGIMWIAGKSAEQAEEFMRDLPVPTGLMAKLTGKTGTEAEWLEEMIREADANGEPWVSTLERWTAKVDAAKGFGQQFVDDTKFMGTLTRSLRVAGAPLAIAGDVSTIFNPPQSGGMGIADQVVAGVNAGAVGLDGLGALGGTLGVAALADLSLGPVGAGIAVGTGLYLAGAYAYAHWTPFRDVCNQVGDGTVHVADDIGHGVADAWHSLGL
jgi:hypothetical protein